MKQIILEDIKAKMLPILTKAGIKRASLFGSYVRGEETKNSDVDLLVDFPEGTTLFDVAEIQYKLEDALGKQVDLVGYKTIKPLLKEQILSEQIHIL